MEENHFATLLPFPLYKFTTPYPGVDLDEIYVRVNHLAIFGRGRKHAAGKDTSIRVKGESFLPFADVVQVVCRMRPDAGSSAAKARDRFLKPIFDLALKQVFPVPSIKDEDHMSGFLASPLTFIDLAKLPRPQMYRTSNHHPELPAVFTPKVQKLLREGAAIGPEPVVDFDPYPTAKDYNNCKTEHELLNPTEEDLKPSVVNHPRPQPEVIPAYKKKPGKPGNFIIPQDKTGAHPFAATDRDRIHRMDKDTNYLMLWGSAGMPSEPMKSLDEGKKLIEIGLAMALEEGTDMRDLNIDVIAVARDGSIHEWNWKAEKFEPTEKWGPFELIPAASEE